MARKSGGQRLDDLIASLLSLSSGQALEELVEDLGTTARELVDEGFERGRAPTGRRWPRPKRGRGRFRPMIRTGRLRRSYVLRIGPTGFEIVSEVPYAHILQRGVRGRFTPRQQLPEGNKISARWDKAMRKAAREWMRARMERPVLGVGGKKRRRRRS